MEEEKSLSESVDTVVSFYNVIKSEYDLKSPSFCLACRILLMAASPTFFNPFKPKRMVLELATLKFSILLLMSGGRI